MKKIIYAFCAAMLAIAAQAQTDLRLMTYNIKNATGLDGVTDYQRVADAIARAGADVVAVQEVDSMTRRSGGRYVLGEVAMRARMHAYFAPAINYDGGKYGVGILAKERPLRVEAVSLPGREEARALLLAEFPGYVFCSTHLSLTPADRLASVAKIEEFAASVGKPVFLAGDFNDHPQSEFMKMLQQEFKVISNPKRNTFPADKPTETIDYILIRSDSTVKCAATSTRVPDEPLASDHRPVVADVRLAVPADKIFRTEPYLQNPVDGGMTVVWETRVPAYSWVEYGTDTLHLRRARTLIDGQALCNNTLNKIRLDSLQPGRTYYYRICSQEMLVYRAYYKAFGNTARSAFSHFTLPAASADSFTAVVFNDLHQHGETFEALLSNLKNVKYDFVVFNGDCIDDPESHDQATHFINELVSGVHANNVPAIFMRGNHEIRNAYSVGLRDHFDYLGGKTYGAFSWGDTRFVLLDCGEDKPDDHWVYYGLNDFSQLRRDEAEFLKKELKSRAFKKAAKRVLIHHIPLYGNDGPNLCADLWLPLLEKAPFNVCLNAHTHKYAYHPTGELGNNYPVVNGGGPQKDSATVMIITKRGKEMRVKVINAAGQTLLDIAV